jgi:hypothetical protein
LSHTWTDEEVAFQEFLSKDGDTIRKKESKKGFIKIMKTCELATEDGIGYVWVDTCCIDKSSSAELSEAINSMWRYYKDAEVCYAYLSDLPRRANVVQELKACKWFTRGWTLQELIAPKKLRFYDETWHYQGTKNEFAKPIHQITKISPYILRNPDGLGELSIAERITWASKRETTRIEDTAYCLLGIFDINMPLLYGEGNKAFIRLQQEIIKNNNDLSIFGWCPEDSEEPIIDLRISENRLEACTADCGHEHSDEYDFYSILAPSPKAFAKPSRWKVIQSVEHSVTNRGIKIDCSLRQVCLRGCSPDTCRCCSHCRKYVLAIGRHKDWKSDRSDGIILNKTGPDTFIRSKQQLIKLSHFYPKVETKHGSIYLLRQTPFNSQDTFYGVYLDVSQCVAGIRGVHSVMPESNWDFAKRRWHPQDNDEWGIVGFVVADQQYYPERRFYVLFVICEVFILDFDLYGKDIALLSQATSTLASSDVLKLLRIENPINFWQRNAEKEFDVNGRAVRLKAEMRRWEGSEVKSSLAVWTEGKYKPFSRSACALLIFLKRFLPLDPASIDVLLVLHRKASQSADKLELESRTPTYLDADSDTASRLYHWIGSQLSPAPVLMAGKVEGPFLP